MNEIRKRLEPFAPTLRIEESDEPAHELPMGG